MATVSHTSRESAAPWQTHTVFNQVPALEGLDLFTSNLPLVEATQREGASWVSERAAELGRLVGGEPQQLWGRLANENKPVLRTFDRYGHRIDEVEFHPAWHQLMQLGVEHELHSLPWTSTEPTAHTARAALYMTAMQAEAGFCCPITMTFAVVPALRAQPRAGRRVGAAGNRHALRPAPDSRRREGRGDRGHGDDREAGRLRRARQHDTGAAAERRRRWRRVRAHGPQVVLQRTDVGCLPRARPDGREPGLAVLLLASADPPGRKPQRVPHPAAEGQARQPLERLLGDRAARRLGADGRRARPWRADDHRDGRAHAPGLRDRLGGGDAHGRRQRASPHCPPQRVRQDADRPAADAQRARRPVRGVRGDHRAGDAPGARLRRGPRRRRGRRGRDATRSCSSASRRRSASTGRASARPTTPSRRSSASAGPATWRSRACRVSTARPRSPRSGRARAT